ncbi:MAG: hypothetical protein NT062_34765 [Proteobacteria bacterium]|nr:hypothetical protein [Pseudomonadota bacterium]
MAWSAVNASAQVGADADAAGSAAGSAEGSGAGSAAPAVGSGAPAADAPPVEASSPPMAKPKPPVSMVLKEGGIMASLNLEMAMNATPAATAANPDPLSPLFKPTSIAPDVSYGVTKDLTVGIITSNAALNGFRGAAGAGLCLTGKTDAKATPPTNGGCRNVGRDIGVEGLYSLMRGSLAVAADLAILDLHYLELASANEIDLKVGFKVKYTAMAGKFYAMAMPSVFIALTDRTTTAPAKPNADQFWFPVSAWFKVIPALALGVASGIKGPFGAGHAFGDNYTIPVGVLAQYMVNKQVSVGTSFVFGKIVSGLPAPAAGAPSVDGADFRAWQLWLSYLM